MITRSSTSSTHRLTFDPISLTEVYSIGHESRDESKDEPKHQSTGAFVCFVGIIRDVNEGKSVKHLEYEAFIPMAEEMIQSIEADAKAKWDLLHCRCIHRLGLLSVSDVAVVVTTSSMHRSESYEANRYIIDRVKHEVPIWKKEFYTDGTHVWSKGCAHP